MKGVRTIACSFEASLHCSENLTRFPRAEAEAQAHRHKHCSCLVWSAEIKMHNEVAGRN